MTIPSPRAEEEITWNGGWHRLAQKLVSPNYGVRPMTGNAIDLIVLHSISLPPGEYGTGAVQQLFTNTLDWDAHPYFQSIRGIEVSSHFFIDRGGVLWQFVDCDLRAWHAGQSFYRGRGQCNDDSIGIELEGLEGLDFDSAQYETLTMVCRDIAQRYPVAHIAGHEHIAPNRKKDPGQGFRWEELQARLNWPVHCYPASTQRTLHSS